MSSSSIDKFLTESGRQALKEILSLASKPMEVVECVSCSSIFETLCEADLRALDEALPGRVDFTDVDWLCASCVKRLEEA